MLTIDTSLSRIHRSLGSMSIKAIRPFPRTKYRIIYYEVCFRLYLSHCLSLLRAIYLLHLLQPYAFYRLDRPLGFACLSCRYSLAISAWPI